MSFGRSSSSGERNRRRHEAVVQFMLAYILERDGELDSFAREFKLSQRSRLHSLTEYRDSATGDRHDHLIVDSDFHPVAIIEDKIDAGIGPSQLDRYARYLDGEPGRSDLIVIHPARRNLAAGVDTPRAKRVRVQFITWDELSRRMIDRTASPDRAALWEVLAEFAENVGTGDLSGLPAARPMVDRDTAGEVRDIILTGQTVARTLAQGRLSQLAFSMHPLNPRPWLQAGMSGIIRLRAGPRWT